MQNHKKVILFIPLVIALMLVFGVVYVATASSLLSQSADNPDPNSAAAGLTSYIPVVKKNYCSQWESPFSVEIAALHQIPLPAANDQKLSEEQNNLWFEQAFPSLLAALKDSGAGWTRIVLRWNDFEPNAPVGGQLVIDPLWLGRYDYWINQISQTGVKIIAVINTPPSWANDSLTCPAVTPAHIPEFSQFLDFLVKRYSQAPYNISTWEIFNESDNLDIGRAESHSCFGIISGTINGPEIYNQILTSSYPLIKGINPNATVLMSGIAYEDWNDPPVYHGGFYRYFPDDVITHSLGANFDALNFHYFPDYRLEWERWNPPANPPTCSRPPEDPGIPFAAGGIDVIAKKNYYSNRMSTCLNVNKDIWLTELAEHGEAGNQSSLDNQAYYVIKGYSRALSAGIKNITWFALGVPVDTYSQALLYEDFSPKPAFYAFKTLISQLTTLEYTKSISIEGGEAYVFANNCNTEKIVAWGNNVPITISPAAEVTVTDYHGTVSRIQDGGFGDADGMQNGSIQVWLSVDAANQSIPVFIEATVK